MFLFEPVCVSVFCFEPVCVSVFCFEPVCVSVFLFEPVCVSVFCFEFFCFEPVCVSVFCFEPVCVSVFCFEPVCVSVFCFELWPLCTFIQAPDWSSWYKTVTQNLYESRELSMFHVPVGIYRPQLSWNYFWYLIKAKSKVYVLFNMNLLCTRFCCWDV